MSRYKIPRDVKLVVIIFSSDIKYLDKVEKKLIKKFGIIDYKSKEIDFKETDYYEKEMGKNLKLRIISFKKLVKKNNLPDIKHISWKIEKKFTINSKRLINIDPGLLSNENFILATGKGYSHRIYLDRGVWADLTLIYHKDGYEDLEWTYPSYKNQFIKDELLKIRKIYRLNLLK